MDVVILHGTLGSPAGNWFPWLKEELEAQGHAVYVPTLPTPENQTKEGWCAALREQAPNFNENTILIGHSCGATFVLHVLETLAQPVAASVLVSVVMDDIDNVEYDTLNHSFVHHDFDWPAICANMGRMTILHGENDPYVPLSHPQNVAKKVGIEPIIIPNGGHLNADSDYTSFPQLLEVIDA